MKTEFFSIDEKDELFAKAHSMHDCSFTASYEDNTLILTFGNLNKYCDSPSVTPWFQDYKKLTIKYHNTDFVDLKMKYGRKEKDFYNTINSLSTKELIMLKFSVDSFDQMLLEFYVYIKKKSWQGTIKISPDKIEYIWE